MNRVSFQTSRADARALEPRRVDRSISSNLDASIDDRVEASIARDGGIFQSSLERARSIDDVDARRATMPRARTRVGINGFGRIGRLAFRVACDDPTLEVVHVNETPGSGASCAYLGEFDSVHGRWTKTLRYDEGARCLVVGDAGEERRIGFSACEDPEDAPWASAGCEVVMECTGAFLKMKKLESAYFGEKHGGVVKKVVVSAPVKCEGALNVVYGVNHGEYDAEKHRVVTAASCTTNCIAPVIYTIHKEIGVHRGSITTVHNVTNTQSMVDAPNTKKDDLRRARSGLVNLAPTSTGSATAVQLIIPELKGKLNGLAVRVPLINGSLTDIVLETKRAVTVEEVNALLKAKSEEGPLVGIMGYEEQPLVSTDFVNDPRSGIVDAQSTMVVDGTHLKLYVWYDNEYGYSCRMVDCVKMVAASL